MFNQQPVTDADISIVVQGAIDTRKIHREIGGQRHDLKGKNTENVLIALKNLFPRAEVILSAWEGADTSNLLADKIILSKDPKGCLSTLVFNSGHNVNRQIISSLNGLKQATRPFTLKLRSDLLFVNDDFLTFWNEHKPTKRLDAYRFFEDFILNPAIYARKSVLMAQKTFPLYLHPSDWAHFGRTEDILKLFDIDLLPEPQTAQYFEIHSDIRQQCDDPWPEWNYQFPPEQHILLQSMRKHGWPVDYEHRLEYKPELQQFSDCFMANNFITLNQSQWLFFGLKHPIMQHQLNSNQYNGLYSFEAWQADYQRLIDPTYPTLQTAEPQLRKDWLEISLGLPVNHHVPTLHQLDALQPHLTVHQVQAIKNPAMHGVH
jgi:hypothetical protein